MKQVIVITGASSGFGALAARTLAQAGHTVYASMPTRPSLEGRIAW
jgi:NADP-dependent 3-hydroxy acid dehydrogenase YdfG